MLSILRRVGLPLLLALVGSAMAAQPVPREGPLVPFRVENQEGRAPAYVLGENRFDAKQLAKFVVGIDTFLRRARGAEVGDTLVWRIDGHEGYLALSTSPFPEGPRYLLALRGETIRPIRDEDGVLAMASLMGILLLEPERVRPRATLLPPQELVP